jgi:hypothetical protein
MIPEVPPSLDETAALALEDIAPTYPYEDPTLSTEAAAEVVYMALVDQHMVPLEGAEDRMPNLLSWNGLPSVRHLA